MHKFEIYSNTGTYEPRIAKIIRDITRECWGDPGELVNRWLEIADVVILLINNEQYVGFAVGKKINSSVVTLVASAVISEFQGKGYARIINKRILKILFCATSFKSYLNLLISDLYIVFRTPNPRLISSLYKEGYTFPSIHNLPPKKKEIEIFQEIIRIFSISSEYDNRKSVIYSAYMNYPSLIYTESNIPWSEDSVINKFCERNLRLTKQEGNTMVVIRRLNLREKLFLLIK